MFDFFRNLFTKPVDAKREFNIPAQARQEVVRANRASLDLVSDWIDETAFSQSCFQYGVPDFIKTEINKPIGEGLTYTDLMLHISRTHFPGLNYLEIGVSVGKNFFQMLNAHQNASFTGFDIEEINPVLEKRLILHSKN
ncbi:MAG: hypothetical protein NVV59_12285 [Chitinophagaceae bacterium]|nr:hypothetical protein [Chitinophagaceae bacterium]